MQSLLLVVRVIGGMKPNAVRAHLIHLKKRLETKHVLHVLPTLIVLPHRFLVDLDFHLTGLIAQPAPVAFISPSVAMMLAGNVHPTLVAGRHHLNVLPDIGGKVLLARRAHQIRTNQPMEILLAWLVH